MWHYAAGRKLDEFGNEYWSVREVYEGTAFGVGGDVGWTANGITPMGETREDLAVELALMLRDIGQYPAFDADADHYTELPDE